MKKFNAPAAPKTIVDLYNDFKSGKLLPKPAFQRHLVWINKDKESFIETILDDFPFPEVFLCQGEIDVERKTSIDYVVDGQQRLTTIFNYIDNKLELSRIPKYDDLKPESRKADFLNYNVSVRQLGKITDQEIVDIFSRLNKTDYTLNSMEKINAVYNGEYIVTAKQIVEKIMPFLEIVFLERARNRMQETMFVLQLMTVYESGVYATGDKDVDKFVKHFDEEYPNKQMIVKRFLDIVILIAGLELKFDTLWFKKSMSFTLIAELLKFFDTKTIKSAELKKKLEAFEEKLLKHKDEDKTKNDYAMFYHYVYSGTASRTSRDFRGKMLAKVLND